MCVALPEQMHRILGKNVVGTLDIDTGLTVPVLDQGNPTVKKHCRA